MVNSMKSISDCYLVLCMCCVPQQHLQWYFYILTTILLLTDSYAYFRVDLVFNNSIKKSDTLNH